MQAPVLANQRRTSSGTIECAALLLDTALFQRTLLPPATPPRSLPPPLRLDQVLEPRGCERRNARPTPGSRLHLTLMRACMDAGCEDSVLRKDADRHASETCAYRKNRCAHCANPFDDRSLGHGGAPGEMLARGGSMPLPGVRGGPVPERAGVL